MAITAASEWTGEYRPPGDARAKVSFEAGRSWAVEHATGDQLRSFERCELPDASRDLHLLVNDLVRDGLGRLGLGERGVDFFEFRRGAISVGQEIRAGISVWQEIQAGTGGSGSPPGIRLVRWRPADPVTSTRAWS
jgi:hypothetical protein